ncbi:hypothetical protein DVF11_21490 [Salmonella enterica subsp. enterica serovar Poona]|nr:hypothetical protein [Salmonella enterica subsp. enterica serovar Poona]
MMKTLHLVLPGRGAPVRMKKIRDCLFSDLSEKREKVYVLYVLYVLTVLYVLYCTVSNVLCIFHSKDTLPV